MKHCFLAKRNTVDAKAWLDKHYLDSAPAKSTVEKWFAKLKRGDMCIEGDARKGRPKEAVKIILNDRKVKLIEIAETLKISKEPVGYIVHEYLDMQMLCVKWLPRMLTIDQNQQHVDDSEKFLAIFNRNKYEFFHRYITMDVTWLLHNTPESNRQSVEWTERKQPNTKRGKTHRSAGISNMGCAWYYIHRLPRKGPDHQQRVLHGVIGAFKR
jgi:hypothetical protein